MIGKRKYVLANSLTLLFLFLFVSWSPWHLLISVLSRSDYRGSCLHSASLHNRIISVPASIASQRGSRTNIGRFCIVLLLKCYGMWHDVANFVMAKYPLRVRARWWVIGKRLTRRTLVSHLEYSSFFRRNLFALAESSNALASLSSAKSFCLTMQHRHASLLYVSCL